MKHSVVKDEGSIERKRLCYENETCVSCHSQKLAEFKPTYLKKTVLPEKFLEIERSLATTLDELSYSHPVAYVYNPMEYAFLVHSLYVNKYCNTEKRIMFLAMNPGPWGMSQTGIPFGEVNIVRDWLGISGEVGQPKKENPARPILGFACKRSEISGQRFWSLFKDLCGEAKQFFEYSIVYNHCPIAFMTESGTNITPNELKLEERKAVTILCDKALKEVIELFSISVIITMGRFAEKRALTVLKGSSMDDVKVVYIPHPSPRNFGNAGKWNEIVREELEKNSLMCYFKGSSDRKNLPISETSAGSAFEHSREEMGRSSVT